MKRLFPGFFPCFKTKKKFKNQSAINTEKESSSIDVVRLVHLLLYDLVDEYRHKTSFRIMNEFVDRLVAAKIYLTFHHPYTVGVKILKNNPQKPKTVKSDSSDLTITIGDEFLKTRGTDELLNEMEFQYLDRIRGHRNEKMALNLTKEIIKEHNIETRCVSGTRLDINGVDFALSSKGKDPLFIDVKSSDRKLKKQYFDGIYINNINGSKNPVLLKKELWEIIKSYCKRENISYI